jgi:hypothetical protein
MENQLEIFEEKNLIKINLPTILELVDVKTVQNLKEGELVVKNYKGAQNTFVKEFKPLKQMVDDYKKKLLDHEKKEIALADPIINEQEKRNSDFKKSVLILQREIESLYNSYKQNISSIVSQVKTKSLQVERYCAEIEKKFIESQSIPVAEKIDAIEEKKVEIGKIEEIQNTFVPEIVSEEKLQFGKKKDQIKVKTKFTIQDENLVKDWLLQNHIQALRIEINLNEFNKLSPEIKESIPGVGSEEIV